MGIWHTWWVGVCVCVCGRMHACVCVQVFALLLFSYFDGPALVLFL